MASDDSTLEQGLSIEFLRAVFTYDPDTGLLRWRVSPPKGQRRGEVAGRKFSTGYIRVHVWSRTLPVHRVAWAMYFGRWPRSEIDHINHDRADNRIANLREASSAQNSANLRLNPRNQTGVRGVYWNARRQKYCADIAANRKRYRLGYFDTLEAAKAAYDEASLRLHGPFGAAAKGIG